MKGAGGSRLRRRGLYLGAVLLLFAGGLEVLSRILYVGWFGGGKRPLQPYFGHGAWYEEQSDEVMLAREGPAAYGYQEAGGVYVCSLATPVQSIADRGEFLFQDRSALANDVENRDLLRVFFLGASAAIGYGASTPENYWFVQLETMLSESLGRTVRLVPAAMSGYVSTQERIVLDLVVLERQPAAVILLDGWNDAALPAHFGSRPGDPYDQGIAYKNYYSAWFSAKSAFAKYSTFCKLWITRDLRRALERHREAILADASLLETYRSSTASVYLKNVARMRQMCQDRGIPWAAFLQPARAVTVRAADASAPLDSIGELTLASYQEIRHRMARGDGSGIVDLTALFDQGPADDWYLQGDPVHFGDRGQRAIAEAMLPVVLEVLREVGR